MSVKKVSKVLFGTLCESACSGNSTPILSVLLSRRDFGPQLEPVLVLRVLLSFFAELQTKCLSPSLQGLQVCNFECNPVALILVTQYNVKDYLLDPFNVLSLHCCYGTIMALYHYDIVSLWHFCLRFVCPLTKTTNFSSYIHIFIAKTITGLNRRPSNKNRFLIMFLPPQCNMSSSDMFTENFKWLIEHEDSWATFEFQTSI